jgi:thiol-disulfide isomerase/thioredoxin
LIARAIAPTFATPDFPENPMRLALTALLAAALAVPAAAAPAPKMAITSFEQLAKPLPLPYDEAADAHAAVAAARARAKKAHKLLLVDFGGNWCLDCRILAGTIEIQPLKAWVDTHYEVVTVNIGRYDANMDIPASLGVTDKLKGGVPALAIVDPRGGKLLDAGRTSALEDARHMSPQGLADWLAQWVK